MHIQLRETVPVGTFPKIKHAFSVHKTNAAKRLLQYIRPGISFSQAFNMLY
jgi:hypothetical protein